MPTTFITADTTTNTTIGSSYNVILLQGVTATSTTSVYEYTGAADLSIYGHVYGGTYAITENAAAVTMTMNVGYSGSVYGSSAGIYITQFGATVRLLNDGHISAEGRAVLMQANDISITNNGTISSLSYSGAMAFYSDDNENSSLSVTNTGLIANGYATAVTAVYIQNYADAIFRNSGTVSAHGTSLFFSSTVNARVENSGSLEGAIETSTTSVVDFTLINSGFVGINDEGYSLYLWAADNFIRNTGEIQGDIGFFNLSDAIIINGGTIGGDVVLNNYQDTYRAVGNGVTLGTVYGQGGNDALTGGAIDDRFEGGTGADTMRGADGDDILLGDEGDDRIIGGNDADTLRGGDDDDTLFGGNDDDAVFGDSGDDFLFGGYGNDEIWGGADDDRIFGGDGADEIDGGAGRDVINTGTGADTVVIATATDSAVGGATRDIIYDFTAGEDVLDLATIATGVLSFLGTSALTGTANEVQLIEAAGNTRVMIDVDADGTADAEVLLIGTIGLTEDDFVL